MTRTSFDSITRATIVVAFAGLIGLGAAMPAFAASGGGGGGSSGSSTPPKCRQGLVWDQKVGRCVKAQASNLPDKELLEQGRALALAGHYDDALIVLDAVKNKQDAMVLTYIGYSHRKKGDTDTGIAYYKQALAIDPDNLNTHEYLGEGYASAGRMELAKAELGIVEKLCGGKDCEQYEDLAAAIAGNPVD
ncbi:tetratricopeptide repeat protein [Kaistia granuli]|uniref:tetratricopeptide repeat protein n=1 Tax=Kaistia granuli TaxID=363259 RepID=UPI000370E2DC|nr:tetratricopeptide repeat protein [Kaistia granuli]